MSFLGGGTDFPWFFREHGGAVISAAIDRYIYVSAIPSYEPETTYLKYSSFEKVNSLSSIHHPIFREVLMDARLPGHDFAVMSDIPGGTGLGSSSAFTVGLINLIHSISGTRIDAEELARKAIEVELEKLGEPIGVQDHLPAAYGSFSYFEFSEPFVISRKKLDVNLDAYFDFVLVPTGGYTRSASEAIRQQMTTLREESRAVSALLEMLSLTQEVAHALSTTPEVLVDGIRESWKLKKASNPLATSSRIEEILEWGIRNGALAGKLLGAGESGFVLLVLPARSAARLLADSNSATRTHQVRVEHFGSKVMEV